MGKHEGMKGGDLAELWQEVAGSDASFIAKKIEVGSDLASLVVHAGTKRADVARALSKPESRLSKVLSGDENLTLKTIFDLCRAIGYDFQVVFRPIEGKQHIPQPWTEDQLRQDIYHWHEQASDNLNKANQMFEVAKTANQVAFRRAAAMKSGAMSNEQFHQGPAEDEPMMACGCV